MTDKIRIAGIADSAKLSTGFANVSRPVFEGFVKAGFDLYAFGILDWSPDINKQLPYPFWPSSPIDPMGKEEVVRFVNHIQPDLVWIMIDPGNLLTYAINLIQLDRDMKKKGLKGFKILAYPPVEGKPLSMFQATAIRHIKDNGGEVVLWCQSAVDEARRWLPEYDFDYVYFGNDHLTQPIPTSKEREILRSKVGLDRYFVAGSVGVNKRTKGFPTLIYAAVHLKKWGYGDKIRFYCHTDPANPTMGGHHLIDMADRYGVRKMFLWKPDNNATKRGNPYFGDDRTNGTLERVSKIRKPQTPKKRMELWETYDFCAKLDCMDLMVDTSQVEGWGLPQCFHPQTPIFTILGQKPISEIKTGDLVLTHTGEWYPVKGKMSRLATAKLIKTRYNHSIVVTEEHPVLAVKRGKSEFLTLKKFNKKLDWIPVNDLKVGDILVTPKPKLPTLPNQLIDLRIYSHNLVSHSENELLIANKYSNSGKNKNSVSMKLIAEEVGVGIEIVSRVARGYGSVGKETKAKIEEKFKQYDFSLEKKWLPAIIELDEEISELMGWYVAEGSFNSNTVELSMGATEIEDGIHLTEIIQRRFGLNPRTIFNNGKMRLCVDSSLLGNMLEQECGKWAFNKKVSKKIVFSNEKIIKSFLKGYTRGDGSVSKNSTVSITTVSRVLAYQIKELLLRVGVLSTLKENEKDFTVVASGKAGIEWATISEEDDLIDKTKRQGQGYYEDDNYFYYPIIEIIENYYSGPVFNIEVAEDNSYVASYIAVHNCEAMGRGVPLMSVHDYHVRDELYGNVAHMLDPLPPDLWDTWHTGARLVTVDPQEVAKGIMHFYEDRNMGEIVAKRGLQRASEFKWERTQQRMNEKMMELYNG